MASVMLYLALSACATTAVGIFAAPDEGWDAWFEWDPDEDCSSRARSGIFVGDAVGVGSEARTSCERAGRCAADPDEGRRRCEG